MPAVYVALKVVGGLYLCYLGFHSAKQPLPVTDSAKHPGTANKSFWLGFTTQASNPKTAIVYASVFAAFLPPFSLAFAGALLVIVFLVEAGWYAQSRCLHRGHSRLTSPTRPGLTEPPGLLCSPWV